MAPAVFLRNYSLILPDHYDWPDYTIIRQKLFGIEVGTGKISEFTQRNGEAGYQVYVYLRERINQHEKNYLSIRIEVIRLVIY